MSTWNNATVMADNMAVWAKATVVYVDSTVQIFLPDGGGGILLDETFTNADIYEQSGNSRVEFRSSTGTMAALSDGEVFDRLKVMPQKGCNCAP